MPRQQFPDQQQYQKKLNPDHLVTEDDDADDTDDTELDTETPPVAGERLAQDESEQRPDDNIDQVEDEEAEDDEDESDGISQRP